MKLIPTADDPDGQLFHRLVSENNLIEMGVYRVLYGWRVRAGFIGNGSYNLDWCGGGDWKDVERLYSLCFAVLSNRSESINCFKNLPPFSKIKPFHLDRDFVKVVSKEVGDFSLIILGNG